MSVSRTIFKWVLISGIALVLISCAGKNEQITQNPSEPAWVNNMSDAQKEANEIIVAVGSSKFIDGNVDYATNMSTMSARAQLAQSINAKLDQAIKQMQQQNGLSISEDNLIATKQSVTQNIQQTKLVTRWVDKKSDPQTMYVLVSMDKQAYQNALKNSLQPLGIDKNKAQELSDTVESMLKQ